MAVSEYVRSPAALWWTLVGALAVGAVVAGGWEVAWTLRSHRVATAPNFLGGLGGLVYVALAGVVVALAALAWFPAGVAVACAVGGRVRGDPAGVAASGRVLRRRAKPLYRWLRTRVAVAPIADAVLTEEDVAPNEVAVGCAAFVVPALVLDAATLPQAVELANRVTPPGGRDRLLAVGAVATVLGGVVVFLASGPLAVVSVPTGPDAAAVAALVAGAVVTAAVDAAWRASVYARADLSAGFAE